MKVYELTKQIQENKIAIYGIGYVAKRFYEALEKKNLLKQFSFFITSSGGGTLNGYDVLSIADQRVNNSLLILIAVHESLKDEIIANLHVHNCYNYIWVYPMLYDLILGEPIKQNINIPVKEIWLANRENYFIAARYLAIDNYYGKNDCGYEIYKMSMSLYNNPQTSEKRLLQFIQLIESWEKSGCKKGGSALLFDDYSCIDGAHRISLASYFGQKFITCSIYACSDMEKKKLVHNSRTMFPKSLVQKLNIDKTIVNILEETNRRIDEQYGIN